MVRVIPVHNFSEQKVSQIEEPIASCVVNSPNSHEFLLLALTSHCVEVHKLNNPDLKLHTTFPTVDMVEYILHCSKGNYIATLETKFSRDNVRINNFVRVYVNWETHDQRHAMRARIAGRVTPSLNRPLNSLEMIELPLTSQPTAIACCQKTGNLLVASGSTAVLHEFKIEVQQPSKQKFIDFEARPWSLGFHFAPTQLQIIEDFISVMDSSHFVVFRLTNPFYEDIDILGSTSSTNSSSNDKTTISTDILKSDDFASQLSNEQSISKTSINTNYVLESKLTNQQDLRHSEYKYAKSYKNSTDTNINFNSTLKSNINKPSIDWDHLIRDENKEINKLITSEVIEQSSLPVTIGLPSINLERATSGHVLSPFILNSPDTEVFIKTTSPENGWSENYVIKNMLRLKIMMSHDLMQVDGCYEFFTCSTLKPLYLKVNANCTGVKKSILRSDEYKYLHGVTCLICTIQEGYVYHFSPNVNSYETICLTSYPFTAPVSHIALEYTVLHALTEAGLESYTLRLPHYVAKTLNYVCDANIIYPDLSEPVCLIGLRPFLGIQQLLSSNNYVVLLAKSDDAWTLYSLKIPNVEEVYFDILNAAKSHKLSNSTTYRHLLEEACSMLWLANSITNSKATIVDKNHTPEQNTGSLEVLFKQTCALLGDYYIKSENKLHWHSCIQFYKMSGLKAADVLSRKSVYNAPGLLTYLEEILNTIKSGPEADALFQGHNIVDIISMEKKEDMLKLIVHSTVLREYATEKLIKLLLSKDRDDFTRLALALLYIQAEKQNCAEKILDPISKGFFKQALLTHPHLLFEENVVNVKRFMMLSFSELAGTLMRRKTTVFAEILTQLIQNGNATFHQVVQAFMEYLPSRVGRDGHDDASALQLFIEVYLQTYFKEITYKDFSQIKSEIRHNYAIIEALKILVRSYLGKLVQIGIHKVEDDREYGEKYLFAHFRPQYLDKMPPCAKDFRKVLNALDSPEMSKIDISENETGMRYEVLKLQALLASGILPADGLKEIERFLETENVIGKLAFQTLCMQDTNAVTLMLMEECPQAVLPYAKCKYTTEVEWKTLVEMLPEKINESANNRELQVFFTQTTGDTLKHVAETLPLKSVHNILPKQNEEIFQHFMSVCTKTIHAEHVKSLIKEMSQQLLFETTRTRFQELQNLETSQQNGEIHGDNSNYAR